MQPSEYCTLEFWRWYSIDFCEWLLWWQNYYVPFTVFCGVPQALSWCNAKCWTLGNISPVDKSNCFVVSQKNSLNIIVSCRRPSAVNAVFPWRQNYILQNTITSVKMEIRISDVSTDWADCGCHFVGHVPLCSYPWNLCQNLYSILNSRHIFYHSLWHYAAEKSNRQQEALHCHSM